MASQRSRWLAASLVAAILVSSVLLMALRDRRGETPVYRKAAHRALTGRQFYRPDDHPAFTYPPFFVFAYMPLARLPEAAGRFGWYVTNFALLAGIIALLARTTQPLLNGSTGDRSQLVRRRTIVAYVLTTLLAARFIISPIEYQSHDLIVMMLAMLAIWNSGRLADGRAGGWAGLAAACKATPLLFLVLFTVQRRVRAIAALLFAVVAATLLPDLFFTNPDGELWAQTWYRLFVAKVDISAPADAENVWTRWNMLNQSISGTMYRLTTFIEKPEPLCWDASIVALEVTGQRVATMIAQILVLAAVVYAARPRWLHGTDACERRFRALGQGSAVLCAMLLLSPMTSKQHFCVLLAPISFLATDLVTRRPALSNVSALLLVLVLGTLGGKDISGEWLQMRMLGYGSLTWCTAACLVACGAVLRGRAQDVSALREDQLSPARSHCPADIARRAA